MHPQIHSVFHPDLLVSWLASKEGMQTYTDIELYPGSRVDLDTSKLNPASLPKPGRCSTSGSKRPGPTPC